MQALHYTKQIQLNNLAVLCVAARLCQRVRMASATGAAVGWCGDGGGGGGGGGAILSCADGQLQLLAPRFENATPSRRRFAGARNY